MGKSSRVAAAAAKIKNVTSDRHETTEIVPPAKPSFLPPLPSEMIAQREAETGVVLSEEERLAEIKRLMDEPPVVPLAATAPKVEVPKVVVGRTVRYDTADVIVVLKTNPKRPETAGHARYAVYETGMKVEDYLKDRRIGKFGRADIAWDLGRSFIRIVPKADLARVLAEVEHVPAPGAEAVTEVPAVVEAEVSAEVQPEVVSG